MSDQPTIHERQPVATFGAPLGSARAAAVMVHGRGASARDILTLAPEIDPGGIAYLAPQASGHTWYPKSFLEPLAQNEPHLSSALATLAGVVAEIEAAGIPRDRIVLLGFSQGACLALEFAARHARRWGGVVGLSGGLIGSGQRDGAAPPDDKTFVYGGSLDGTPVFLGCSDVDPHIPVERVRTSARVLGDLGGAVDARIYPGMGHTINADELEAVRAIMAGVAAGPSPQAS